VSHPDGLPDLFLDRSLGRKKVPELLRAEGLRLVTLAEHYGIPARRITEDARTSLREHKVLLLDERGYLSIRHLSLVVEAATIAETPSTKSRAQPLNRIGLDVALRLLDRADLARVHGRSLVTTSSTTATHSEKWQTSG
jgi:hypothetical protein